MSAPRSIPRPIRPSQRLQSYRPNSSSKIIELLSEYQHLSSKGARVEIHVPINQLVTDQFQIKNPPSL